MRGGRGASEQTTPELEEAKTRRIIEQGKLEESQEHRRQQRLKEAKEAEASRRVVYKPVVPIQIKPEEKAAPNSSSKNENYTVSGPEIAYEVERIVTEGKLKLEKMKKQYLKLDQERKGHNKKIQATKNLIESYKLLRKSAEEIEELTKKRKQLEDDRDLISEQMDRLYADSIIKNSEMKRDIKIAQMGKKPQK